MVAGIAGFLVVLALPAVRDLWEINRAGMLLNRAIVTGADAALQSGAAGQDEAVVVDGSSFLLTPRAQALLERAIALMDSTASRGPHNVSRETAIWRTYGAAARLLPSDHSFELLFRSRNAGRLDWYGELWLGEVAAATGHWDEATAAYRRVDVSNLLVYRAEAHIKAGQKGLASRELSLAKTSLDAQVDREKAKLLLLDRTGNQPSALDGMRQRPAERATTLWRIGQGLLSLGQPADARTVLEQGLALSADSPPGVTVERNLRLDLAAALAQTLPETASATAPENGYFYYPARGELARLGVVIRIRALAHQALELDRSAISCARAGGILISAGDESAGIALLSEAISIDPLAADAYLEIGAWFEDHQMPYAARRLYEQAAEALPDNPSIISALAVTTFNTLPCSQALPLLRRAADLKTTNVYVFAFLSDCYLESGRQDEAKLALEEGLLSFPEDEVLTTRRAALPSVSGTLP